MTAGYSGTPLAKKLGIKPDARLLAVNAPKNYRALLEPLPEGVKIAAKPSKDGADIVHVFATSLAEFQRELPKARAAMKIDGAIWVSWHKKSAKIPTDVTEDEIRSRALKTDLVDVKVCAVSEEWSGLKLVVRKCLR
jgi:hypothetical protein